MKKALGWLSLALGMALTPSAAQAGLLLEPHLAYELSVLEVTTNVGDAGGKISGTGMGARIGYTFPVMFWVAADYSVLSGGAFDSALPQFGGKVDRTNLYIDVGVDLPILLRAWFGYGIGNSATVKFDQTSSLKLSGGSAYKIGLGVTTLPFVSVNFEYFKNDFKDYDWGANGSGSVSGNLQSFKDTGFRVGVSLPLDL